MNNQISMEYAGSSTLILEIPCTYSVKSGSVITGQ